MQGTKGIWRMREQCVPGSLSSSHVREPGNEAKLPPVFACRSVCKMKSSNQHVLMKFGISE